MMNRLFIALEIPYDIREKIINYRNELYPDSSYVRWEPIDKLHITLKFLGDVDLNIQEQILNILESIVLKTNRIACSFEKFGLFYTHNRPKILWAGLSDNKELEKLALSIDDSLSKLNFEREHRKFKSHITLLRFRGKENREKIDQFLKFDFPALSFTADKIAIIKSELLPTGSVYSIIKSFNLI